MLIIFANSLHVRIHSDFCRLLITYANSLDPDQDRMQILNSHGQENQLGIIIHSFNVREQVRIKNNYYQRCMNFQACYQHCTDRPDGKWNNIIKMCVIASYRLIYNVDYKHKTNSGNCFRQLNFRSKDRSYDFRETLVRN